VATDQDHLAVSDFRDIISGPVERSPHINL
jgi:hypothetical protein